MNSIYLERIDVALKDGINCDTIITFISHGNFDHLEFKSLIDASIDSEFIPEWIFVIFSAAFSEKCDEFIQAPPFTSIVEKVKGRCKIVFFSFNGDGNLQCYKEIGEDMEIDEINQKVLPRIERMCVTKIFDRRSGVLRCNDRYHFSMPSGKHTSTFLRALNLIQNQGEVLFLGFLLLRKVMKEVRTLYIDTSAMLPICAGMNEHLLAFQDQERIVAIKNFNSYAGLEKVPMFQDRRSFFLISATSSGSLSKRLQDERGVESNKIIHLLFSGGSHERAPAVICDLRYHEDLNPYGTKDYPENYQSDACPLCASGSIALPLLGGHFDPIGPQPDPLELRRADMPAGLEGFMKRYANNKILCIGFGNSAGKHFFHIDYSRISEVEGFEKDLQSVVKSTTPSSTNLVIYLDEDSKEMAEKVRLLVRDAEILSKSELFTRVPEENCSNSVVICGFAIDSGRSLIDVSRELRRIRPQSSQVYILGIVKYENEKKFNWLKSTLGKTHNIIQHQVHIISKLQIGHVEKTSPWVKEFNLIQSPDFTKYLDNKEANEYWRDRAALIGKNDNVLIDNLFCKNSNYVYPRLKSGFMYWPDGLIDEKTSQADVFWTISSVIQNLRSKEPKEKRVLIFDQFRCVLLHPSNFSRFSDGAIQASLLRAAHPSELNYSSDAALSRIAERTVLRILRATDGPAGEAAAEFLLALCTERMKLTPDSMKNIYSMDAKVDVYISPLFRFLKNKFSKI